MERWGDRQEQLILQRETRTLKFWNEHNNHDAHFKVYFINLSEIKTWFAHGRRGRPYSLASDPFIDPDVDSKKKILLQRKHATFLIQTLF